MPKVYVMQPSCEGGFHQTKTLFYLFDINIFICFIFQRNSRKGPGPHWWGRPCCLIRPNKA